jgi:hypothetical protein
MGYLWTEDQSYQEQEDIAMKFTDDNPEILEDIRPVGKNLGPVALSNHSQFGFNIRHFYLDWQTKEYKATQKGVAIVPADLEIFLAELETFINVNDILNGRAVTIVVDEELD